MPTETHNKNDNDISKFEERIPAKKAKKRPKDDRLERAMDVIVTKVVEGQRESDRCFLDLETKRMKLEEKIYEMERLTEEKEREKRQR